METQGLLLFLASQTPYIMDNILKGDMIMDFTYLDKTYSTKQVAILLDVSEASVRSWIKSRKLGHCHSQSNQGAFLVMERQIEWFLRENPKYKRVELTGEKRREFLLAAKDKCRREIGAAETAIHREMLELNQIIDELFREGES